MITICTNEELIARHVPSDDDEIRREASTDAVEQIRKIWLPDVELAYNSTFSDWQGGRLYGATGGHGHNNGIVHWDSADEAETAEKATRMVEAEISAALERELDTAEDVTDEVEIAKPPSPPPSINLEPVQLGLRASLHELMWCLDRLAKTTGEDFERKLWRLRASLAAHRLNSLLREALTAPNGEALTFPSPLDNISIEEDRGILKVSDLRVKKEPFYPQPCGRHHRTTRSDEDMKGGKAE